MKESDRSLRELIRFILDNRTYSSTMVWVRGHSGDQMNEQADAANIARAHPDPFLPDAEITDHSQFFLSRGKTSLWSCIN